MRRVRAGAALAPRHASPAPRWTARWRTAVEFGAAALGVTVVLIAMLGMFWVLFVVPLVAFLGGMALYGSMAQRAPEEQRMHERWLTVDDEQDGEEHTT